MTSMPAGTLSLSSVKKAGIPSSFMLSARRSALEREPESMITRYFSFLYLFRSLISDVKEPLYELMVFILKENCFFGLYLSCATSIMPMAAAGKLSMPSITSPTG